ncbi:MAG TPA: GNAT family N-acetyltransferase [Gaiella sp.]|nr:GNAT family N-acetyltransferase [Gaiella sp.]
MAAEIVVRRATRDDAPALARLSIESSAYYARIAPELFAEGELDGFAEWIAAEWDDGPDTLALVAEVEGSIAGYVEAVLQEPEPWRRFFGSRDLRERRLFVNAVLTGEPYRRRGIATRLVEKAEAWGRERGATVSLLDTWAESPASVPFWERRMGYGRRTIVFRKRL